MVSTFKASCTEVYEIIKKMPKDELEKIPKKEIDFLEKNMDKSYFFECNKNIFNEDFNLSLEAKTMIVILWEKYFASDLQKQKLKVVLEKNQKKVEEENSKKYSYDKLFEENRKKINSQEENDRRFKINENEEKNLVVIKKENMLNKIKNFLKHFYCKINKKNNKIL